MKKKWISLVMAVMMTAALAAGCGSSSSGSSAGQEKETQAGAAAGAEADAGAANTAAADEGTGAADAGAGAGADSASAGDDLLAKVQNSGKLVIAMEGNWAPWTYENEDGELVGFEVEVSRAVAEKLGVTPEYVTGEWDGLLAGVQAGRYDVMANGVGYTEERAQAYYYSDFYAFNRTALVVRGDNEEIKSLEDLDGKTTCNSANSTYQLLGENTAPPSRTWSPWQERSTSSWRAAWTRHSMRRSPSTTICANSRTRISRSSPTIRMWSRSV